MDLQVINEDPANEDGTQKEKSFVSDKSNKRPEKNPDPAANRERLLSTDMDNMGSPRSGEAEEQKSTPVQIEE